MKFYLVKNKFKFKFKLHENGPISLSDNINDLACLQNKLN